MVTLEEKIFWVLMNSMGFDWFVLLGFGIGGFLLVFFVGLVKIVNLFFGGGGVVGGTWLLGLLILVWV